MERKTNEVEIDMDPVFTKQLQFVTDAIFYDCTLRIASDLTFKVYLTLFFVPVEIYNNTKV